MYSCTDCGNHVCEDHSHFGSDGLEQCARSNIRRERAEAGPPPPPPPGGGGGQGGPSGQGGGGSGGHGHAPFPPPGPGHPGGGQGPAGPPEGPSGAGDTLVEHPGSMVVLPTLMELRTISVVRVSMVQPLGVVSTVRALVLALVSPMLLQATLQASGMPVILERVSAMAMAPMVPIGQGMAVFFLKQEETTGETGAPSVTSGSPLPVLLWSHALVVE